MKVSIVTAVLNSHEIVRRQLLHYSKMNLPDDVEVIIVDDGSDPSIGKHIYNLDMPAVTDKDLPRLTIYETKDYRDWTQPAARNFGAKKAKGEFCIFTDIDHIVTRKVIELARDCPADVVRFKREAGILDENGDFTQDWDVLRSWGYNRGRLKVAPHSNSFIIRTGLFLGVGGVSERRVGSGKHPNREEIPLKRQLKKLRNEEKITVIDDRTKPMIYMMPNGRYCGDKDTNPFGLFHSLKRQNG